MECLRATSGMKVHRHSLPVNLAWKADLVEAPVVDPEDG